MNIKNNLDNLKSQDIYSLILFALYKIKDIPEFSSLSELAYVLDKKNLLNLCEYFGGVTITIPTVDDLEYLTYSLLLYQYVKLDKMDYDAAIELVGHESKDLRKVKKNYLRMCEILDKYSFVPRENV